MRLVFGPCDVFLSGGAPHRSHISHYTAITSCDTHVSSSQRHVVQRLKDTRQGRSWNLVFGSNSVVRVGYLIGAAQRRSNAHQN